jgi:hypothetical protein
VQVSEHSGGTRNAAADADRSGWRAWVVVGIGVLALGLAFQGSRGLWEPDEGFYASPALGMVRTGDWVVPRLNGEPFIDKPPLVYWGAAAGMAALGRGEWGARLALSVWFAGTALVVGLLAAHWWGRRTGMLAAFIYATMLAPFLASNVLTPDTPLAFASALSFLLFWRFHEASRALPRLAWGAALGLAIGLGALAKGPAILVMAGPLAVFLLLQGRLRHVLRDPAVYAAAGCFLIVALPWPVLVGSTLPGAWGYLLDNWVTGRLVSADYARNAGLWGGLIYVPVLLIGSLPWGLTLLPAWRRRVGAPSISWERLKAKPTDMLLALWFVVPLAVFVVARSRLPLYVLPLFAPLALAAARRLENATRVAPARARATGVVWVIALLGLKAIVSQVESPRDSRRLADELTLAGIPADQELIMVDTKRSGISLYGWENLRQVTRSHAPYPFFSPAEALQQELDGMKRDGRPRSFVVGLDDNDALQADLGRAGIPFHAHRFAMPLVLIQADSGSGARPTLGAGIGTEVAAGDEPSLVKRAHSPPHGSQLVATK